MSDKFSIEPEGSASGGAGPSIPPGTGYLKQGPPGTITNSPTIPSSDVGYSPANPSQWLTSPATVPTALDLLAERTADPIFRGVLVTDEDFLTFSTTGTVLLGSTVTWQTSVSGTGATVTPATAAETTYATPGCVALATGTTTTGRAGLILGPSSGSGSVKISDGANLSVFDYESTWYFSTLFTATETGWFLTGLNGTVNAVTPGNYGLFWRYDGGAAHNLSAVIRMSGAETGSALNILTVSAGTVYRTRVVSDGASVRWMYSTGRSGGSWVTSLTIPLATIISDAGWPTNLVGAAARVTKTAGTTSVRALLDRFKIAHNTF